MVRAQTTPLLFAVLAVFADTTSCAPETPRRGPPPAEAGLVVDGPASERDGAPLPRDLTEADLGGLVPDQGAGPPDAGASPGCQSDADCAPGEQCQQGSCVTPPCGTGPEPVLGQTTWPVPTVKKICQKFGNPISYQTCGFHTGIDVCAPEGDPLVAIAPGVVTHVGYLWYSAPGTGRGPYAVIIQHSPNFYSTYSHNKMAAVKIGDCVTKGQKIGEVGNLGYSSGPHLHFEILDGTPFTGNWQVPFANACSHYVDPQQIVQP